MPARSVRVLVSGALAAVALAVGSGATAAHAVGNDFHVVHVTDIAPTAMASPDADTLAVAGLQWMGQDNRAVVETRFDGTWYRQTISDAAVAKVWAAADDGVIWLLTEPQYGGSPTLWKSTHQGYVEVGVAPVAFDRGVTGFAVDGDTATITGTTYNQLGTVGPGLAVVQHGAAGWTTRQPSWGPGGGLRLVTTKGGHLVVDEIPSGDTKSYVFDLSRDPAVWYGPGATTSPNTQDVVRAWTARNAWDFTMWGYTQQVVGSSTVAGSGVCKRFVDGDARPCPAPTYPVYFATHMADDRQVVTSDRTETWGPRIGLVATDGTISPLTTDYNGDVLAIAASSIGSTVWIATTGAGYQIEEATL